VKEIVARAGPMGPPWAGCHAKGPDIIGRPLRSTLILCTLTRRGARPLYEGRAHVILLLLVNICQGPITIKSEWVRNATLWTRRVVYSCNLLYNAYSSKCGVSSSKLILGTYHYSVLTLSTKWKLRKFPFALLHTTSVAVFGTVHCILVEDAALGQVDLRLHKSL
jgi:hypothetical protein